MADSTKLTDDERVAASLFGSGFPFQTAVQRVIQSHPEYRIVQSEVPWRTRRGDDEFLDILAARDTQYGTVFLAVECKKAERRILTFLRATGLKHGLGGSEDTELGGLMSCLQVVAPYGGANEIAAVVANRGFLPETFQSQFCVVTDDKFDRGRLLEADARPLVEATEMMLQRRMVAARKSGDANEVIVPVIVTNATLYTVKYSPDDVSLETGRFHKPPPDRQQVPYIRFRKTFTTWSGGEVTDIRTVFVVNSASLKQFLREFRPVQRQPWDAQFRIHDRHLRALG